MRANVGDNISLYLCTGLFNNANGGCRTTSRVTAGHKDMQMICDMLAHVLCSKMGEKDNHREPQQLMGK